VRAESTASECSSVTSAEATSGQRRTERCLAGFKGCSLWIIELHFAANSFSDVRTGGVAFLVALSTPTLMNCPLLIQLQTTRIPMLASLWSLEKAKYLLVS
jgi:hypothetical protein